MTDRQQRITDILTSALQPLYLQVRNESGRHAGHAGDDGSGETHFHAEVVSEKFSGMSRVARQRTVYALLDGEFQSGLHALSLRLLSGEEKTLP